MNCPVCPDVTLSISSREGVEIDFCPQCRGVWLDRGELDKIIERAAADRGRDDRWDDARRRPEPVRERYDDRYDPRYAKRKRRSFLEDLFDFD